MLQLGVFLLALASALAFPPQNGMLYYFQGSSPYYYPQQAAISYQGEPYSSYRAPVSSGVSTYTQGSSSKIKSYLKDRESGLVQSVAEAYPEEPETPNQFNDEQPEADEFPKTVQDEEAPLEDPVEDQKPLINPRKKTQVQVQYDDEDPQQDEVYRKPQSSGAPTYFPITIGRTHQGAIAIANAYSAGRGGTAASRATAYGSPKKGSEALRKPKSETREDK